MTQAYIIAGARTPIGSFGGTLAAVRPDDLAALVMQEAVKRSGIDPLSINDCVFGCANQAGEDNRNVARMAVLLAGLPIQVPAETVNRLCASGLSSVINSSRAIQVGDADIILAGGVENMTRGPWVISKTSTPYGRDAQMFDTSFGWRFVHPKMKEQFGTDAMGETAENLVDRDKISREDQDKFSVWSQQKATQAQERGAFAKEIIPVSIPQRKGDPILFAKDEFIKSNTTLEGLAKLKPSFRKEGTVTAGNASGLNDGAAALIVASEQAIKQQNLKPLARIVSMGVVGVEPRIMGIGPVKAAEMALAKAGLQWNDIDIIELNEAFAAQALACVRSWGLSDTDDRINPQGGAIALGHPLGMTGARIALSAALQLQATQKRYALVTMCIGVGQGYAVILERA
jgi:acetyl-CoA acyltransferase